MKEPHKQDSKRRRYFFKVESLEDAKDAIKISSHACLAVAIFLVGLAAMPYVFAASVEGYQPAYTIVFPFRPFDSLPLIVLTPLVYYRQSRIAAMGLMMFALYFATTVLTVVSPFYDGRIYVIAAVTMYGAYYGIVGTLNFHARAKPRA